MLKRFSYHNILIYILIFSASYLLSADEYLIIEPWKIDLQILLGFTDDQVDGVMGKETFEALKKFAFQHDITDVVIRGEFDDLGFWGFQQYMMKYHQFWIRELKNRKIIEDVSNKEYIQQAEETLYSFEIAIQNAQLEVERLTRSKTIAKREAREKQVMDEWQEEKQEVERIITALNKAILTAEEESEKWSLERIRAQRLAEEQEQLARLEERKLEASILTSDLEDAINVAKREIDRLVDENKKLKSLISTSTDTKNLAVELKAELKVTKIQMDSLSDQKDSLEKILKSIDQKVINQGSGFKDPKAKEQKKKWYQWFWPFGKD